jgi:DNA-binding GntR family transcriptional regulator
MDYRTKEEQVADYLRERIISGVFPRGSRLKQAELAKELGLSITPVREALKLLAAEGYVSGDSYRGARVMPFDPSASAEILVRAAAEKITSADLEALRLLADEFAAAFKSEDRAVARGVNYRLHRRLYDVADLPQTLHFVQILWARYPFDVINGLTNRGDEAIKEHEAIFQALSSGDISAAIFCMRKHIESGWVRLKESNGC